MSFFDKFGSKMGLSDDKNKHTADSTDNKDFDNENDEYDDMSENPDNIVDFKSAAASSAGGTGKQMRVIIIEPASFDDAQQIADHIKARKPVVLNFENTDADTTKRIIDFISGATYALAGDIKKVGQNIFLCAPNNVNVTFSDTPRHTASKDGKLPWE